MATRIVANAAPQLVMDAANWKRGDDSILFLRNQDEAAFRAKIALIKALAIDLDGTAAVTNTFREMVKDQSAEIIGQDRKTLQAHIDYVSRTPKPGRAVKGESIREWLERRGPDGDLHRLASESGLMANNIVGLMRSGFTQTTLRALVARKKVRHGAQVLCATVTHAMVISAGFENAGELFLERHAFPKHVEIISGFRLLFADDGTIAGVHHNLYPSGLKGDLVRLFREEHFRLKRENLLCVGDTPWDAPLLREGGLAIGLLPPEDEDPGAFHDRLTRFAPYWDSVDAMLVGDSLQPLADLLEESRTA